MIAALACFAPLLVCQPTACTEFSVVEASGYLYCADHADRYSPDDDQIGAFPPGHWRHDAFYDSEQCLMLAETEY